MIDGNNIRFATFNASLNRSNSGSLINDLSTPDDTQTKAIAEIIQRNNSDVILINEFDYDAEGEAIRLFQENYLSVSQNGVDAIKYPYVYFAPSNTGIDSGFDFNNNGNLGEADDAFGFGFFPGQYGMVLLSKYPIVEENVRTFQNFLWQDMPGALLPDNLDTLEPNDWYFPEELEVFRLSSKSHWDIPININGEVIHVLASHPTPPVFDGAEDRNGKRNHDEIRFWSDYITSGKGDYIYDDNGNFGGLNEDAKFVIMGDLNADPFDGDSTDDAVLQLLNNPQINISVTPHSQGGPDATIRQDSNNLEHLGNPAYDTADFGEIEFGGPGNLRADYVLPSHNLEIINAGVFWPESDDPNFDLVGDFPFPSSDHRLVFADVTVAKESRKKVTDVELLGIKTFETGFIFAETEVGGLSGIAYDRTNNLYYSISDDRSQINPARFYTLNIDLADGSLDDGDINFESVTTLSQQNGDPFVVNSLDPEGIAISGLGTLYISSEGNANELINPFINQFSFTGQEIDGLNIPAKFLPTANQSSGIRNNQAFESLTISPDKRFLYAATENALYQDGETTSLENESSVRIIKYDLTTEEEVGEFVYIVDAIPQEPIPADGFADNGLVELLAIDNNGTLLALERSFAVGVGNTIRLYEINTQGALDVSSQPDLFWEEERVTFEIDPAVNKRLLVDLEADLGISPDNVEGMTLGPILPDGSQSLILVSDNNFSDAQTTQFIALGLDLERTPVVLPALETPYTVDDEKAIDRTLATPEPFLAGDSDDPAIWLNPDNPEQSLILATLKDGGLVTFDLDGNIVQQILPADFGDIRYNNVDLIYNFEAAGFTPTGTFEVDLAVVSDRENDSLAIYSINPETRQLEKFATPELDDPAFSIFGVDDGEATAYGLAAYTSPIDGKSYVFVTQAGSNQIAQLELIPSVSPIDEPLITAEVVRILELPVATGDDVEDYQSEAMVVDQELGILYVAVEGELGIVKVSAEVNGGDEFSVVQPIGADYFEPDLEGLTIYYGENGKGYLIASSQRDSSYAVFSRENTNEYLGSFVIGDNGDIDQVNETDGLDVINVPLGDKYPFGLMVVQDGANDPQFVAENDEELENRSTNFKFVPWENVANGFDVPLDIDPTSFDPRNPQPQTLVNSVASGDTNQNSTVLWARSLAPGEISVFYSKKDDLGLPILVTAEVTDINQPVKIELTGLNPDTEYSYTFTDAAGDTASGSFKTAAEVGSKNGLNFGVTGDWRGEVAPYPAIANVVEQNLEFFVEHGDTIYADIGSPAVLNPDGTRKQQVETLDEYRAKHSEVYGQRLGINVWADIRSSTSILATIDDHEVTNDFAGGDRAANDDRFAETEGLINDTQLYENGLQAFQEYNPLRDEFYGETGDEVTEGERKLYRYNTYGSDAAVMVLDTRSFRDGAVTPPSDISNPDEIARVITESFAEDRTLLGEAQLNDLKNDLLNAQESGITWKFIMIPEPIQNLFPGINTDAYEGYNAERTELLKFINDNGIENVVFIAADVHTTFVNNLTYQETPFGEQIATSAWEVTTGSVAFDEPTGELVGELFTAGNPEANAFYNSLPVTTDTDDIVNDKDDFVKQAFNDVLLTPLGYDPLGLNNNLPQAQGLIDATLIQGDYFVGHTYGWTQFEINPFSQQLRVTTYGIEAYSEEELLANPDEVLSRQPVIVSKFVVNPEINTIKNVRFFTEENTELQLSSEKFGDRFFDANGDSLAKIKIISLPENGTLELNNSAVTIDREIDFADIDRLTFTPNEDFNGQTSFLWNGSDGSQYAVEPKQAILKVVNVIEGNAQDNTLNGSDRNDLIFGRRGNDAINGNGGDDIINGNAGNETINGGTGIDRLIGSVKGDGNLTLTDTELVGNGTDSFTNIEKFALRGGEGDNLLSASEFTLAQVVIRGKEGNDTLNDTLIGGAGDDIFYGGEGRDTFVLRLNGGRDFIADFEDGIDKLALSEGINFEDLTIGNNKAGTSTSIGFEGQNLAILRGIDSDLITENNFQ